MGQARVSQKETAKRRGIRIAAMELLFRVRGLVAARGDQPCVSRKERTKAIRAEIKPGLHVLITGNA